MAGPVLADEHNSELSRVFAFQAYDLVGEEVKKKKKITKLYNVTATFREFNWG